MLIAGRCLSRTMLISVCYSRTICDKLVTSSALLEPGNHRYIPFISFFLPNSNNFRTMGRVTSTAKRRSEAQKTRCTSSAKVKDKHCTVTHDVSVAGHFKNVQRHAPAVDPSVYMPLQPPSDPIDIITDQGVDEDGQETLVSREEIGKRGAQVSR